MTARRILAVLALALAIVPPLHAETPSPDLQALLDRAGDQVERFWRQFSSVSCTETIEQAKLGEDGKTLNQRHAEYDYVIFMQLTGNELKVEESRQVRTEEQSKKKKRPSNRALLITSGFPIMELVFHPHFQNRYFYRPAPDLEEGLQRVDFEQVAGASPLSVLRMKERDYPLHWVGSAWIDPSTGIIKRIQTRLAAPLEEVGLRDLTSDVRYSQVPFQETQVSYWLPDRAEVEAFTEHQHWRNTHLFSQYRRFSVNTAVSIGEAR